MSFKKETVFTTDDHSLSVFIKEQYGMEDRCAFFFAGNDTAYVFSVTSSGYPDAVEEMIKCGGVDITDLGEIMDDLCSRVAIEPGTYILNVCW